MKKYNKVEVEESSFTDLPYGPNGQLLKGAPLLLKGLLKIKEKGGKKKKKKERKKDRREGRKVKKKESGEKIYKGKMKEKNQRNQEQEIVDLMGGHGGPAP